MLDQAKIDTRHLESFNKTLQEYLKWNDRELGPLLQNRAQRMRWELYKIFSSIAPTADEVSEEAVQRGYKTKRRMEGGRRVNFEREIKIRRSSVKYLSVAWMLRDWRMAKEGQNVKRDQINRRNRKIGEVIDRTAKGVRHPYVEITSLLRGAVRMNAKRGLITRALARQEADMREYIYKKQKQKQAQTIAKLNAFTKGISV